MVGPVSSLAQVRTLHVSTAEAPAVMSLVRLESGLVAVLPCRENWMLWMRGKQKGLFCSYVSSGGGFGCELRAGQEFFVGFLVCFLGVVFFFFLYGGALD